MFRTKFFTFAPLLRRISVESIPKQSRKPNFDANLLEESLRPYADEITRENQYEKLANMVLPLANFPYDQQLKIKQESVEQTFDQIANAILWDKRIDSQVLKFIEFKQGAFCQVRPIIRSLKNENYRCLDELSCGYSIDGEKTVGFYINPRLHQKSSQTICVQPVHLKSMKEKHLFAIRHFDRFIKEHSLNVCESQTVMKKDQYWRTITLKSNDENHLMMIVVIHPQSLSKFDLDRLKNDVKTYFTDGPGRECEIQSIYVQFCGQYRCSPDENPFELIHGEKFLYENYLDKRFRISPSSFLQANKSTAEILIRSTLEQADLTDETILLDIGSAIGIFSILAADKVKKVYSIDPFLSSIDDGKFNAELNRSSSNIEWIGGFPEGNLHRVLKKISDLHPNKSRIVAIVNPSRYSLTNKTTSILRSFDGLERIFYILSKIDRQAMQNFYELSAGEKNRLKTSGRAFVPSTIDLIDLLPHTTQVESIVQCVRV